MTPGERGQLSDLLFALVPKDGTPIGNVTLLQQTWNGGAQALSPNHRLRHDRRQELDGHRSLQRHVMRQEHDAHPSAPDLILRGVPSRNGGEEAQELGRSGVLGQHKQSYLLLRAAIHVPPTSQVNKRLRPTFPDRTTVNPDWMSARRRSSGLHRKHESLSA